jgi:hypothetical protein
LGFLYSGHSLEIELATFFCTLCPNSLTIELETHMGKTYYAYMLKLILKSAEISSIKLGFFGPHFALTIDWFL